MEEDEINPLMFNYVFHVHELNQDMIREFTDYLYSECVLCNYSNAAMIYSCTQDEYESGDYDNALKGDVWINPVNDFAEIFSPDKEVIERINYRS